MCGFFFVKYRSKDKNEFLNNFFENECNNYIKSRGPSYQEIYKSSSMFIYQSVLAIQSSLIKSSNLGSIGSKKFLLYNGEIYNLNKNKEISDTEYIYNLFQNDVLENELCEFDGMYAISNFIRLNENDILCNSFRDPIGEKHLWYYLGKDIFIISSVPAIIRKYHKINSNLTINRNAIDDYLKRRHFISPIEHPINDINNLKPGHKLSFRSDEWTLTETKFFNYESFFSKDLYTQLNRINQDEYNIEFNKVFSKTIYKMESACADKNTSASIISGGYDSSIVGGCLLNKSLETDLYTMTFGEKDPVSKNVKNILNRKYEYNKLKHKIID